MPKEHRIEAGVVHPKYWERPVREAFKNDPLRIVIELIKNAADSYTRGSKMQQIEPPYRILVKVLCKKNNGPYVEVIDNAEGMISEKLNEALKYGTLTSRGEDLEAFTSAEKGIGLKDAMMALDGNWLVTVHDGLINERNKRPDFKTGFGKEDKKVTKEERKRWEIPIMVQRSSISSIAGLLDRITGKYSQIFAISFCPQCIWCLCV